jgi:hypothetical protein
VYPSDPLSIPLDATHIVWYNRWLVVDTPT